VRDYLLFVDTETSGLPKKWNQPYSVKGNWPFSIQIAWIIFNKEGVEIKRENHYINENDFKIEPTSLKVHGITHEFLKTHGERRKKVMHKLAYDIKKYNPMLIGHFMELDFHMLNADFYRSGIESPVKNSPLFCTMLASKTYVKNPQSKFLKLSELYNYLFDKTVNNIHDAMVDAEITAASFFELLKRQEINDSKIEAQQTYLISNSLSTQKEKTWALLFFVSLVALLALLLTA